MARLPQASGYIYRNVEYTPYPLQDRRGGVTQPSKSILCGDRLGAIGQALPGAFTFLRYTSAGQNMHEGGSGWASSRFPAVCTPQMLEHLRGRPAHQSHCLRRVHISIQGHTPFFYISMYIYVSLRREARLRYVGAPW